MKKVAPEAPQEAPHAGNPKGKAPKAVAKVALHRSEHGKKEVLAEHIEAVRCQLTEEERHRCDDAMISRYIRATSGDLKHSLKRIRDTLAWWTKEDPHHMTCTACQANAKAHYMHVVGHDIQERPVIYSCLELATNRNIEDNRRHMISTFEQAIRLMPEGVESWCWVLDFHGFGLSDCDPRLAKIFLNISAAHYPERLGQIFVVSAPMLFNTLWKAIAPMVDPVTRDKIHFVSFDKKGDNSKTRSLMSTYFDQELTDWLVTEMGENRDKVRAKHKSYNYPELSTLAHSPDHDIVKRAQEERLRAASRDGHDLLGTPRLLRRVSGRPEMLLPGLQALRVTE